MKNIIISLLLLSTLINLTFADDNKPKIDLEKYLGKWYEIASFPSFFQRNCFYDTNAVYSITDDNNIKVLNSCRNKNGNWIQSEGKAFANNPDNNKLKVSFLPNKLSEIPFFQANYWILAIDKDYTYALVGTPNLRYLWILSRSKEMPEEILKKYTDIAYKLGYKTSRLVKTKQTTDLD